ncbi:MULTISPECIES: hypothetical protein [unclassified Streptomyces]|uniref:hypothetical protein n=1 Tax=unclassified Streptomyces TaxID=2593676 RepID=UPI0008DE5EEB|nr:MULTISPECIES: hypothetical protein [unclassified Streptomyces]OII68995.1 hypothetical protein BJP39_19135 [Streptomyces sp. CC77]
MTRLGRALGVLAAVAVLAPTASGCVTVHGELEVVPAVSRDEAARALEEFVEAYNAADEAYDPSLDAHRVTGSLGAIHQAGLKARSVTHPQGNPKHTPLELTDARFVIPKKAGWPRWFVADADSNRDVDDKGPGDDRWLLVFIRNGNDQLWEASHLTVLEEKAVPAFRTDADGFAEPVADGRVAGISKDYASYLTSGRPAVFAAGQHTTAWREERDKIANRPGLAVQFADQALDTGTFRPLALATEDGGALVFFATRLYERRTAAEGYRPKVSDSEKPLLTGRVRDTVTKDWVLSVAARLAPGAEGAGGEQVTIVNRSQGVTAVTGS